MNRTVFKVPNNANGRAIISNYRSIAKAYNLRERANEIRIPGYEPIFMRVVLYGRLGKNNPNRSKYAKPSGSWRPIQRVSLDDAAEIAVYINPMKKYSNTWGTNYNLTSKPFNSHSHI